MRPPFYDIMIVVLGQWGVFYKVVMILGEGMVVIWPCPHNRADTSALM